MCEILVLLVDSPSEHHEKGEKNIKVVRLIESFVDLCQELAEYVCARLFIELFVVIVFRFLLLRVKVYIDIVEVALHIDFF